MIVILAVGIATGCVYSLIGLGYSIIYRTTGVVNFAQGSYVILGGLMTWWFLHHTPLPYGAAILAGTLVAALSGAILWTFVVLPLWRRRMPGYVILLCSIVFGAIVGDVMQNVVGALPLTLPEWIPGFKLHISGSNVNGQYLIVVVTTIVVMLGAGAYLQYTTFGRSMRACAASRDTSQLLGISPERIGLIVMTLTAALGGLAGAMITPAQYTDVSAGLAYGVFGIVAAVLGGFGSLSGAFIGGILLGVIQALIGRYVSTSLETFLAFVILLVLLAIRPQGILGFDWEEEG